MELVECSAHIGVEVRGLDRAQLLGLPTDAGLVDALRLALRDRHLLVLRDLAIGVEAQQRVVEVFGELVDEGGDGGRHVFLSNARDGGVLAHGRPLLFHSDNFFTPAPLSVVGLYMLELDGPNAPTRFANTERAADRLSEATRAALRGAVALNLSGFEGGGVRYRDADVAPQHPRARHRVLTRNPRTGRGVLAVSEQQTDRIVDWHPERSESMLQQLFARLYDADNVYEHEWRQGDLCVWDNYALQHGRPALGPGARTLRRVAAVLGDSTTQHPWTAVSAAAEQAERAERLTSPAAG